MSGGVPATVSCLEVWVAFVSVSGRQMKARAAGGNWIDDGPFWYPTTYAQGIKY